jgi:hypothetical protein
MNILLGFRSFACRHNASACATAADQLTIRELVKIYGYAKKIKKKRPGSAYSRSSAD